MESLLAIGVGLVLRVVVDSLTDNDDRISGVLVGLWEGIVLSHFVRRQPRSYDPYLGFGFRIFVDFLFTQSISRLALVALWALVGMLLADIAPNLWRDSGLRHLYRQVRKDVRHVKRAVPRIRIKNDLPSVRLFERSRSTSASSIRSDRAAPSRSPVPSPVPTSGPSRRPGRSPPGTFPNVSGWSETGTDVSSIREHVVTNPASPALIPSSEAYRHIDTAHASTSQTRTTDTQDTADTITQTQSESVLLETVADTVAVDATTAVSASLEAVQDPSRHDPPTIPDDWVDVTPSTACALAQANEPVSAFLPDPDSTPEPQPTPSTPSPSRPVSAFDPPPAMDVLPDIPDVVHGVKAIRPPDQIPLPESRAASVIGGVYDEPQPRSALRDTLGTRAGKAISELGMPPARLAPVVATQSTKSQTTATARTWFTSSAWMGSKLKQTVDTTAPVVPPKEPHSKVVGQGKPDEGAATNSAPLTTTPAQVDPPANILTQSGDAPPLLLASMSPELERNQGGLLASKVDPTLAGDGGVDSHPAQPLSSGADKNDDAGPSKISPLDLTSTPRTPPPPFTEFAGDSEVVVTEAVKEDLVTQDQAPTELTEEQKATEEKRIEFLATQLRELEESRVDLQKRLKEEDDPAGRSARAIESDLEDSDKMMSAIKARMEKKKFSEQPLDPLIREVVLFNKSGLEAQAAVVSAVLNLLLKQDDAEPVTIQFTINRQKPPKGKGKEAKDAIIAFAKRHKFTFRSETATPGIVNVTF